MGPAEEDEEQKPETDAQRDIRLQEYIAERVRLNGGQYTRIIEGGSDGGTMGVHGTAD